MLRRHCCARRFGVVTLRRRLAATMGMLKSFRVFWMAVETLSGFRRKGFFIPYRYADTLPAPGTLPLYPAALEAMRSSEPDFVRFFDIIDSYSAALESIGGAPPPEPRWDQDWFPRLDAASAYAVVRHFCPRRIVEVGSGHSTRFMTRAIDDRKATDKGLLTTITAIDPAPRADVTGLSIEILARPMSHVVSAPFDSLESGDILFIDSSHILMPGSDVDSLFNRVLPALPGGVLVHIHDVFLPDDYPNNWAWRGYNEQLLVLPLISGGGYDIVFSSRYAATRMQKRMANSVVSRIVRQEGALETSLWLRKRE